MYSHSEPIDIFGQEERIRTDATNLLPAANPPIDRAPSSSTLVQQETSADLQQLLFQPSSTPRPKRQSRTRSEIDQARRDRRDIKAQRAAFLDNRTFALATQWETAFRHSGWRYNRARVINSFVRTNAPEFRRMQFERCGSCCTIKRKVGTDEARIFANYCHDRWCVPCQQARARVLAATVLSAMKPEDMHRFITLTLPHDRSPLKDRLRKMFDAFKRLADMPEWRRYVRGGVKFLEVKIGEDGDWHPHLHLITHGTYFPGVRLTALWEAAVGQRCRTHIKIVEPMSQSPTARVAVAKYLTTYAVSAIDTDVYQDEEKIDEALIALRGVRWCSTIGDWRGHKLIDKEPLEGDWETICSIDDLMDAARKAQPWAIAMLRNLCPKVADIVESVIVQANAPP